MFPNLYTNDLFSDLVCHDHVGHTLADSLDPSDLYAYYVCLILGMSPLLSFNKSFTICSFSFRFKTKYSSTMASQTKKCCLCKMRVENIEVHMKLNHRKKKNKYNGFKVHSTTVEDNLSSVTQVDKNLALQNYTRKAESHKYVQLSNLKKEEAAVNPTSSRGAWSYLWKTNNPVECPDCKKLFQVNVWRKVAIREFKEHLGVCGLSSDGRNINQSQEIFTIKNEKDALAVETDHSNVKEEVLKMLEEDPSNVKEEIMEYCEETFTIKEEISEPKVESVTVYHDMWVGVVQPDIRKDSILGKTNSPPAYTEA